MSRLSYFIQVKVESAVWILYLESWFADHAFFRVTTIPTVGFNVETVTYKNVRFNVWVRSPLPVECEERGLMWLGCRRTG